MDAATSQVLSDIDMMTAAHAGSDDARLAGPFWIELAERHRAVLEAGGFGNFKRTINFQYSQWGVRRHRSRAMLRIAASIIKSGALPYAMALVRPRPDEAAGIRWNREIPPGNTLQSADVDALHAYARFCALVWQFTERHDSCGCLRRLEEPAFGNPIPVYLRDRLISQDLAQSALEYNRIAATAPPGTPRRVLEIGAGYGRLAHVLSVMEPDSRYTIADIPPALAVSQNYLREVLGEASVKPFSASNSSSPNDRRLTFILPDQLAHIPDHSFDLIINISSFDEMSQATSAKYMRAIDRLGSRHLYLKGYLKLPQERDRLGIDDLPIGASWRKIFSASDPVTNNFGERLFELH